ncbi:Putative metal chaperone YciC [Sporomusa ovata DSM 2662]|uniref:Putative metal chaperone, involved in Zn homeostasis, GTPase of COG0523 family n=1 Tax=Sporomusa ovata TaxID=2378 RepID=A0A0U1L3P8_9FIRM|nr:GTP-binding protein [Sporomusa ovata]EQB25175.1 CobW/P47K family protein [Sporomusa ovata DSM 2662]CQR73733.1 Putative metal chaperone, involved in Zn homeostasis, GTPase of COG0523 family [Sporomusa ovata]
MTTQISVVSGFLGAGKTSFLKKIIPNLEGKVALIENEFGEVGVDGDLLPSGFPVKEIYAGCICCSVVRDFEKAIKELMLHYHPQHILIEPSGVGSLSDIIKVCRGIGQKEDLDLQIKHLITIVDIAAFEDYSANFGGFYSDQIANAQIIFLSYFNQMDDQEIEKIIVQISTINPTAFIFKEDWYAHDGEELVEVLNTANGLAIDAKERINVMPAAKVFDSLSIAKPRVFSEGELEKVLAALSGKENGCILRAKGILELDTQYSILFNFTPHHCQWEYLEEDKEAKVVVIGTDLNKEAIADWFGK